MPSIAATSAMTNDVRARRAGVGERIKRKLSPATPPEARVIWVRPDYVGRNLPTRRDEMVDVSEAGVVIGDMRPR